MLHPSDPLERLALAEGLRRVPFAPLARLPVTDGKVPVRLNTRVVRVDSSGPLVRLVTPVGDVSGARR